MSAGRSHAVGIGANLPQFSLLVAVNLFVGAMIGMERTILPLIAEREFGLVSHRAILSFIAAFGISKAIFNSVAGIAADLLGRRRTLLIGWAIAAPVPFLLMSATSWNWILCANVLLGASQGLSWTTTAVMKLDLAGSRSRGLAMGINEAAGYGALSLSALASSHVAAAYGLRPEPFLLGIAYVATGGALSLFFVRETRDFTRFAAERVVSDSKTRTAWRNVSFADPVMSAATQAGFVTNLNDGMSWGLLPLLFLNRHLTLEQGGLVVASYVGVWAIAQLFAGALADRWDRRHMIAIGMWIQALGILATAAAERFEQFLVAAIVTGLGTATVYPTLLALVGDRAGSNWRGSALGVYRFWRDLGYAAGALLSGILGDLLGIPWTLVSVAALTAASGFIARARMRRAR